MKRKYFKVSVALMLACSMMMTSCIGSFSLTSKLLNWNHSISNKFVNELVFVVFWVLPVYEVSALADVLVLNSIEFWSGTNPIAEQTYEIEGNDAKYLCHVSQKGYEITRRDNGETFRFNHNPANNSWSLVTPNGESVTIFTYIDDDHVSIICPDGEYRLVEISQDGLLAYQHMAAASVAFK